MTEVNRLRYSKPEFDQIIGVFEQAGFDDPYGKFAEEAVGLVGQQFADQPEGFFTVQGLRDGTAPFLDTFPGLSDKIPSQRRFTNEQIISLTAADLDGDPIVQPGGLEAFGKGAAKGVVRGSAFKTGFEKGFVLASKGLSGVPGTTIPTATLRIGGPLVAGLLTGLAADYGASELYDAAVGEGDPELPGSEGARYAGETFGEGLAMIRAPFQLPEKFSVGGFQALRAVQNRKVPLGTRFLLGTEKAIRSAGASARARPGRTLIQEGIAIGGASLAGGMIEQAEVDSGQPLNPFLRFALEGVAAPTSAALFANFVTEVLPDAAVGSYRGYKFVRNGDVREAISSLGDKNAQRIADYLFTQLERFGEDPEELIRMLSDPKNADVFIDEAGNPIKQTAAMKSGSPALLSLELGLEQRTTGLGAERQAQNQQLSRAIRHFITGMYATGNKNLVQASGELAQDVFEVSMRADLENAMDRVKSAYDRLKSGRAEGDVEALNIVNLGETLQKSVENLRRKFRQTESRLWQDTKTVGNLPITTFKDETGNFLDRPNFLNFFQSEIGDYEGEVPEAYNVMKAKLRPLFKFAERKQEELFPNEAVDELDDVDPIFETGQDKLDRYDRDRLKELKEPGELTLDEVVQMRKVALQLARELGPTSPAASGFAQEFARQLELDRDGLDEGINFAYDMARSYSRAYNDAFTRTFAGDLVAKNRSGKALIQSENVGDQFKNTSKSYLKIKQIDGLSRFIISRSLTNLLPAELQGDGAKLLKEITDRTIDSNTGLIDIEKLKKFAVDQKNRIAQFPGVAEAIEEAASQTGTMRNTIELILRDARASALDAEGRFTKAGFDRWMNTPQNREILEVFPDLRNDLQDYQMASQLLDEQSDINKTRRKKLLEEVSFLDLIPGTTEDVTTAVERALSSKTPFKNLNNLLKIVDEAPDNWKASTKVRNENGDLVIPNFTKEDAKAGLESAIIDSIFMTRSSKLDPRSNQTFDPRTAYDQLFAPRFQDQKVSLADWMKSSGLLDEQKFERTKQLLKELVRYDGFASVTAADFEAGELPMAYEFYLRIAGSRAGQFVSDVFPGADRSDLIARAAGSKVFTSQANELFAQIPETLKMDFLKETLKNPEATADLLRKGRSEKDKKGILKRMTNFVGNFLGSRGVRSQVRSAPFVPKVDDIFDEEEEEIVVEPEPAPQPPPVSVAPPPPPPVRAPAPMPAPIAMAAPSPPVDRARFAAMFPNDPTSALIRQQSAQQGIGSLMG